MTTYEINIDETNATAKHFLAFMKTLPFVSFSKNEKKKKKYFSELFIYAITQIYYFYIFCIYLLWFVFSDIWGICFVVVR